MDGLIIRRLRKSDIKAFEYIFNKYYNILFGYCVKFVKDKEVAKETVNDAFVKLWEHRDNIRKDIDTLKPYLFQIVHNLSINYLQKSSNKNRIINDNIDFYDIDIEYSSNPLEDKELFDFLNSVINRLPNQRRKVFMLSRFNELTYSEIAKQLGISVKTVENQISRSLFFIKSELKKYDH
jgi:RNA polymerase sigma-70 factor, ECF subfamily